MAEEALAGRLPSEARPGEGGIIETAAGKLYKVPVPYELSIGGLFAALGPMAINFGISVGGGETMFIPRMAALGGTGLFWVMTISTVLETALVYECIKYSMVTGRSFFTAVRDIPPKGLFWPWFWAIFSLITFGWPAWLSGAASAIWKLTGVFDHYTWAAIALVLVLVIFYFSNIVYSTLSKIFIAVMWVNIITVIAIVVLMATPADYLTLLWGYFNFGLAGYPQGVPLSEAAAVMNQPGGSLMWVSLWVLEAGWGMGAYHGRVTGVLRPPERINVDVLPWDYNDPEEVRKMKGWCSIGKWSLIIWWSIIGAMIMTFLYGLAGHVYLYKQGIVKSGLDVPLQMAYIAGGVFGPVMFGIFLVFIIATLYDGQFAYYDTFLSRTVCEAIAVTPGLRERRPYRFYYFVVMTLMVLAGFYLVAVSQPYYLWLLVAFLAILQRSIASLQILYLNDRLPEPFRPALITRILLWLSFIGGIVTAVVWGYAYFAKI